MTSGNIRKEHEMQSKKKASAPSLHTSGTRYVAASKEAATIIPFEGKRPTAQEQLERSQFRAGVMVGFLAALMIFLAVLWLWVIPTMDQAVADAQRAVGTMAVLNA